MLGAICSIWNPNQDGNCAICSPNTNIWAISAAPSAAIVAHGKPASPTSPLASHSREAGRRKSDRGIAHASASPFSAWRPPFESSSKRPALDETALDIGAPGKGQLVDHRNIRTSRMRVCKRVAPNGQCPDARCAKPCTLDSKPSPSTRAERPVLRNRWKVQYRQRGMHCLASVLDEHAIPVRKYEVEITAAMQCHKLPLARPTWEAKPFLPMSPGLRGGSRASERWVSRTCNHAHTSRSCARYPPPPDPQQRALGHAQHHLLTNPGSQQHVVERPCEVGVHLWYTGRKSRTATRPNWIKHEGDVTVAFVVSCAR